MSTRVAPNSEDAERAVIHCVLLEPPVFSRCGALTADDFLNPVRRAIWEAIEAKPIDPLVVREKVGRGGWEEFEACIHVEAMIGNVDFYVATVKDRAVRRRLLAALGDAVNRAHDTDVTADELLADARRALDGLVGHGDLTSFGDLAHGLTDAIEKRVENRERGGIISGARTGITKLDVRTAGFQDGWLVIIAADTGGGKTALANQTAINVALDGGASLIVNLEMPKTENAERAIVHQGLMNSQLVRTGQVVGPDWERLLSGTRSLYEKPIYFEDRATTMPAITSAFRRFRAKHPTCKAFGVVDFVQLIRSERIKGMTRAQEIGLYAQDLKTLAKDLSMPIALISQLNRAGVKAERPSRHDLKESGDLENAADLILLLWNKDETTDGSVMLIADKFRSGERFREIAHWTGRHYRFSDPTWEEERRHEVDPDNE